MTTREMGGESIAALMERLRAEVGERPAMSSIDAVCRRYGFSRSFFYKIRGQGRGPRVVKLGSRSFVTREDEDAWRASLAATAE